MSKVKSGLWVQALLWRLNRLAVPVVVRQRGDGDAGAVLLKLSYLDGTALVLSQTRDGFGNPAWIRATGPDPASEEKAEAYIERSLKIDGDLWVLEIEDPRKIFAPEEPIL
ncbi:MAG: DUF1491 family protein [Alphaproteobacteria bacterium]|nr:DUF1491 family protein [Alphaproteobacteria bacterium]